MWATFESMIEVGIAETLDLDYEVANLILSGLSFKRKSSILKSALYVKGQHDTIELIKDIINDAKRNTIAHGRVGIRNSKEVIFSHRDSDDRYRDRKFVFSKEEMFLHGKDFFSSCVELQEEMGLTDEMLENYGQASLSLAAKSIKSP